MTTGSDYVFAVEGLSDLGMLDMLPATVIKAALRAVNHSADKARVLSGRAIRQKVNFPGHYVTGKSGRLEQTKYASPTDLEAVVTGRQRPTSLARFLTSIPQKRKDLRVKVAPNKSITLKGAFLLKLRHGTAITDTKHNLGLAVRLAHGDTLRNKKHVKKIAGNIFVLYGPSVDQVFRTVAADVSPQAADIMRDEFLRLMRV